MRSPLIKNNLHDPNTPTPEIAPNYPPGEHEEGCECEQRKPTILDVELLGDEGRVLSRHISSLVQGQDATLKFYGILASQFSFRRFNMGTFAVSLDCDMETGKIRSFKTFFFWDPRAMRLIEDVGHPRNRQKMEQIFRHECDHVMRMHFHRLFTLLSQLTPDDRRVVMGFYNTAMDWEINCALIKNGNWDEQKNAEWDPMPGTYPWLYKTFKGDTYETDRQFEVYLWKILHEYHNKPQDLLERVMSARGITEEMLEQMQQEQQEQQGQGGGQPQDGQGQEGEQQGSGQGQQQQGSGQGQQQQGQGGNQQAQQQQQSQGQDNGQGQGQSPIKKPSEMTDEEARKALDGIIDEQKKQSSLGDINVEGLSDEELKELARAAKERGKAMVTETMRALKNKNHEKSRGFLPAHIQEMIDAMFLEPPIKWDRHLKKVVATGVSRHKVRAMHRPNYGRLALSRAMKARGMETQICVFPGKVASPTPKLVLIIDTSGSMSTEELALIFKELRALADQLGAEVWVITCDTQVHDVFQADSWKDLANVGFSGRGGTIMDPAFLRAKEMNPDFVICYTDGYLTLPRPEVRLPSRKVMWLLTPNGAVPGESHWNRFEGMPTDLRTSYGSVLVINESN